MTTTTDYTTWTTEELTLTAAGWVHTINALRYAESVRSEGVTPDSDTIDLTTAVTIRQAMLDELHTRALAKYPANLRNSTRAMLKNVGVLGMGRLLAEVNPSGWVMPKWNRVCLMDELHTRALAEYPSDRDEVRANMTKLSTVDLGVILDAQDALTYPLDGYRQACMRDELHERALVEYVLEHAYDWWAKSELDELSVQTLNTLHHVSPAARARLMDELHARALADPGYIALCEDMANLRAMVAKEPTALLNQGLDDDRVDWRGRAVILNELHERALNDAPVVAAAASAGWVLKDGVSYLADLVREEGLDERDVADIAASVDAGEVEYVGRGQRFRLVLALAASAAGVSAEQVALEVEAALGW